MEEKKRQGGAAGFFSGLVVLAAALLLAQACRTCRPLDSVFHWQRLEQDAQSAVQQAFSALTDGLSRGENAVEAFAESWKTLNDEAAA